MLGQPWKNNLDIQAGAACGSSARWLHTLLEQRTKIQ